MKTLPSDYQAALDYIYSFVDYSRSHQANLAPENFNLARMESLLAILGDPHTRFSSLHIAGTKGKGSVTAFCANALLAAGYRVGMYTSPHLQDFTERIQVNNRPISQDRLVSLVQTIKPAVAQIELLTTFEITTALAFMYFAASGVDFAVVEVGLGGRLDATNVITPRVSVITSLSYDHTSILGETLPEITREKAGIIKPGVPVVTAPQKAEALEVIKNTVLEKRVSLAQVGKDFSFEHLESSLEGQSFLLREEESPRSLKLRISLLGRHQIVNATTAFAALRILQRSGVPLADADIQKGFAQTRWPGRFEILNRNPRLVVDSAHNPDSASRLRETLDEFFPDQKILLVFGVSEDKDIAGILTPLKSRLERIFATRSVHPRAMSPGKLAEAVKSSGVPVTPVDDIETALQFAFDQVAGRQLILVTGSIFLVAAARNVWFKKTAPLLNAPA